MASLAGLSENATNAFIRAVGTAMNYASAWTDVLRLLTVIDECYQRRPTTYAGNPNTNLEGAIGQDCWDSVNSRWYKNNDGATSWDRIS